MRFVFAVLWLASSALASNALTIRDGAGVSIGRLDSDGTIRDGAGIRIGRLDGDGTLRDGSGITIGRIDSDCTVRNGSGVTIGRFDGCTSADRPAMAAYLLIFASLHR